MKEKMRENKGRKKARLTKMEEGRKKGKKKVEGRRRKVEEG